MTWKVQPTYLLMKRKLTTSYRLSCLGTIYYLEIFTEIKYLGVKIDEHFSFEAHIQDNVNEANGTSGLIRRVFIDIDENMFMFI